jgi:predicted RNA-binding Zn-ribbon protein involved in translation (DUF1610 family)
VAIRVTCSACGKTLQARDSSAGKKAKCPGCGAVIEVPEAIYDAEEIADAGAGASPEDEFSGMDFGGYEEAPADDRRACPACGEMIKTSASRCRYCGEVFDAGLKRKAKKKKSRRSVAEDDENLSAGEWVVAILCSGIGCIMGIIWMIQGKPKGLKMFGISILMQLFWGAVRLMLEFATQQAGR